jgi:arylsulfatase A-like enzyme
MQKSQMTGPQLFLLAAIWMSGVIANATDAPAVPTLNQSRPNIVYIMADDHSPEAISCYGSKLIQTPNIDRIAKSGMRFTHAFANNSICSPSRAVLLTGKYNHLCGVEKLNDHFDGSQQTFPKLLQGAGYQTAIVGKWHLWSQPTGFDYYCVAPGNGGRYYNPLLKETGQPWGDGNSGGELHKGYMTDVITDVSLDWLKHRDPSKPFCLMIHHKATHEPYDAAPRYKDLYSNTTFAEPETLQDKYQGRAPELVAGQLAWSRLVQHPGFSSVKKQFNGNRDHDTQLMYQALARGYLRLAAALDENVGRVLDYLDQSGLSSNTIVIYAADNGFFLGEHGFYNKMWMYEDGFHIPLIIRQPGSQAATTNDEIVSMLDVAPTILDLCGVKVPADIQGVSMKPLLASTGTVPWRDSLYYHYYGVNASPANNWIASPNGEVIGIRTKTAKLIFYPKWKGGPFWELFDLAKDPLEMHNLYREPASQGEVISLKGQLHALAEKYRDTNTVKVLDSLKD